MAHVPARAELARKARFLPIDLAALLLAAASLVVLVAERTVTLQPGEELYLTYLDYAAVVLFAVLFVAKGLVSGSPAGYLKGHWFDAIGVLPLTQPLFGLDRWWGVIGFLIVLARASAALDRAFGERVLLRVFDRYRAMLVEELTEPILVRLLVILRDALTRGRYMASIGASIEEKRADVHEVVRKAVAASPKMTFITHLPGVDRKLQEAVDEAVTSAVTALTSEEMNRIVRDAIDRALRDLETEIAKPHWKERGLTLTDVARGLSRGS